MFYSHSRYDELQNWICFPVSVGMFPSMAEPEKPSKLKALEDLDALGKTLLKQSLPTSYKLGSQFTKYVYIAIFKYSTVFHCFWPELLHTHLKPQFQIQMYKQLLTMRWWNIQATINNAMVKN
jgi:hypothetical protein